LIATDAADLDKVPNALASEALELAAPFGSPRLGFIGASIWHKALGRQLVPELVPDTKKPTVIHRFNGASATALIRIKQS
jgi:hypothetical protein